MCFLVKTRQIGVAIASKSKICTNFTWGPIKKVPSQSGNQPVVIFLTLDAPTWLCSQDIVTPHHFEIYLVFSNEVRSHAFWGSLTPKLIVIISGWTVRDSVLLRVVFFVVVIVISQAVSQSCKYYGLCLIALPCFWAMLHWQMVMWLGSLEWPQVQLGQYSCDIHKNSSGN